MVENYGDLGPISKFISSMQERITLMGGCPACGGWHIFMFVRGNHPDQPEDFYCIEPTPSDSAVSPYKGVKVK
jgi:hypothetical protein